MEKVEEDLARSKNLREKQAKEFSRQLDDLKIKHEKEVHFFCMSLRWLDIVFQGQYLPSLSVNYVAISKDLEKLTPQLY